MANNDFESKWPLHTAVFKNDVTKLKHLLSDKHLSLDQKDVRGRTPLLLAVTLGHVDCARALLDAGANPNIEDNNGYGALQEAISIGDPEFIADIIHQRDLNRFSSRVHGVPAALLRLRDTKDFYVEMKWEFTSWLPMVSSFCPSDTYKIYKRGSKLRVDTTLVGFEQSSWQRGSRSFVFSCDEDGTRFMEFDHDLREVHVETIKTNDPTSSEMVQVLRPPLAAVHARMKSPISTTFLNTDNIGFERAKSGVIGFRSDRVEEVNGHESKVFYASPIEVVTKIRTEHLSPEDKARHKASTSRLTPFLPSIFTSESTGDDDTEHVVGNDADDASNRNPFNITPKEYFDPSVNLKPPRVIGLPREISTRIQRFKATLWLCESFPLSLPEQIAPVIDLMAISSSHFSKYRDFITLHLPQGFPVRIEIPLFRVLNAKITFGNILSLDSPVPNVTPIRDDTEAACVIEDEVFQPPPGYRISGRVLTYFEILEVVIPLSLLPVLCVFVFPPSHPLSLCLYKTS